MEDECCENYDDAEKVDKCMCEDKQEKQEKQEKQDNLDLISRIESIESKI